MMAQRFLLHELRQRRRRRWRGRNHLKWYSRWIAMNSSCDADRHVVVANRKIAAANIIGMCNRLNCIIELNLFHFGRADPAAHWKCIIDEWWPACVQCRILQYIYVIRLHVYHYFRCKKKSFAAGRRRCTSTECHLFMQFNHFTKYEFELNPFIY